MAACAPKVKVDVTLVTRACLDAPAGVPLDPLNGVGFLRFASTSNGAALKSVIVPLGAGTADLPTFAVGTGRIDVEGTMDDTAGAQVLSSGSSGDFQIPSSSSVKEISLTIFLRRAGAFSWTNSAASATTCTGLVTPRAYHTQVLLSDGRVLIYGGLQLDGGLDWTQLLAIPAEPLSGATYLSSAEIYDPSTGLFSAAGDWPVDESGAPARAQGASAPASGGAALLLGGEAVASNGGATFLVKPRGGQRAAPGAAAPWTAFETGSPHTRGCLAVDRDGQSLISGGYELDGGQVENVALGDAPDPNASPPLDQIVPDFPSGKTVLDGPLSAARAEQGCTGFSQSAAGDMGLLLFAGGARLEDAGSTLLRDVFFYRFLPGAADGGGTFTPYLLPGSASEPPRPVTTSLAQPRARSRVARIGLLEGDGGPSEGALVTGGFTCDLAMPDSLGCLLLGASAPPYSHFKGLGVDGGGLVELNAAKGTELIHFPVAVVPRRDPGPDMLTERIEHCAVTLADGRVLILGGAGGMSNSAFGTQVSAEITVAQPGSPIPTLQAVVQPLIEPRAGMACTLLADGSVLVTGGIQTTSALADPGFTVSQVRTLGSAEIFRVTPALITTH